MKKFRDIELLSSYLDGQLSPSESARLESRLSSDPEFESAFSDLRAARGILRKLPSRKAPRNFTLTRQMVGLKPPLPRSYSFFRFSTAFATILLTLTFAVNLLTPRLSYIGPLKTAWGGGYGGGPAAPQMMEAPAATEAPVAMEEAAPSVTQTPAATMVPAPALEMLPMPTLSMDSAATELPTAKEAATPSELMNQTAESVSGEESRSQNQALIPFAWQVILFILILLSGLIAFLLRRSAIQKWK
jgi:anti-sigma factor RsiW